MAGNISTTLEIFSNISYPLDNSHVRGFDSLDEQTSYFDSLTVARREENFKYVRVDNYTFTTKLTGKIRNAQTWGYARIKNLYDSNKYYYAFISKVNYISDSTVELEFQLDFFQTYHFDIQRLPSFVERMHTSEYQSNGLPIINTIDEQINYGLEYRTRYTQELKVSSLYYLVIASTKQIGETSASETDKYVGMPNPVFYYIIPYNLDSNQTISVTYAGETKMVANLYEIFKKIAGDKEVVNSIVSLSLTVYTGINFQNHFSNDTINMDENEQEFEGVSCETLEVDSGDSYIIRAKDLKTFKETTINIENKYMNVPNYRHSKLKMYPYTVIVITDNKGNILELKPEYLSGNNLSIKVKGSVGNQNKVGYYPSNYLNYSVEAQDHIFIDESPNNIPILTDATADYIQGNQNSINTKLALSERNRNVDVGTSLINAIPFLFSGATAGMGIANATSGIVNAENRHYNEVKTLEAKQQDIENIPPNAKNMNGNSSYEWGNRLIFPHVMIKTVTPEYEKKLDDYFHMFGYQVNEIRPIQTHTRRHFNYIKCMSLNVKSGLNREILMRYKSIFENGVTIWHTDDMMNYTLGNEVL